MITTRQLATVRAALQYWREEICPNGAGAARPYLDPSVTEPPTAAEIDCLARQFDADHVRYVVMSAVGESAPTEIFATLNSAVQKAGSGRVATLLLPVIEPEAKV